MSVLVLKVEDERSAREAILNYLGNIDGELLSVDRPLLFTFGKRTFTYWIEVPKDTEGLETLEKDLQSFLDQESDNINKK